MQIHGARSRVISLLLLISVIPACGRGGAGPKTPPSPPGLDVRVDQISPGSGGGVDWPRIATDGTTAYAVWQDLRNFGGAICFNRSSDGGATWLSSDVRVDHGNPLGGFATLPSIACNGSNLYVIWQDERNGLKDVYFNRSADGGVTWLPADVRLDTDLPGSGDSQSPQLAVSGSHVYAVWEESVNGFSDVYLNASSDGGVTWLPAAMRLDTDAAGTAYSFNPQIACSGAGVYVTWADYRTGNGAVRMNRSADGGASWLGSDVRIDHVGAGKTATSPLIACQGTNVYLCWHDDRSGKFDIYFNRSTNSGVAWLGADVRIETDPGLHDSYLYFLLADAAGVYAAWVDERNGGNSVYFSRSADSGATWLATDLRLDTPSSGAFGSNPRLCVSGSTVHAIWMDSRSTADPDVYYNRSSNGGSSWQSSDVRLDHGGSAYAFPGDLCCAGSRVVVAWRDSRNNFGAADRSAVYAVSSSDGGVTWPPQDARVSHTTPAAVSGVSGSPVVATFGSSVYVAWIDYRLGSTAVFFNRSMDSGQTWQPSDLRLGQASAAPVTTVRIANSGSHLFVAWDDGRNGNPDIYFNRSLDGGVTWLASDVRLDTDPPGAGVSFPMEITCVGDDLVAIWTDNRAGNSDIYANRSADGGLTWRSSDVRVDRAPAGAQSYFPQVWRNGSTVGVAWQDTRNGLPDVYFNRSTDGGVTWLASDRRLDTDSPGAAYSLGPTIAGSGSHIWVAWEDTRSGGDEIRLNHSVDGGLTWLAGDLRIDRAPTTTSSRTSPRISVTGGLLVAVWQDGRGGSSHIYFTRSTDGGATWLASDVRVDSNPNANQPTIWPNIIGRGSNLYVVWEDCRDAHPGSNDSDLYVRHSSDGGLTWGSLELRLDVGDLVHKQSTHFQLSWDGAWPVVVWDDMRNGSQDIFFSGLRP